MVKKSADPSEHLRMPFRLKHGAVVVFEGLDGTGKSTQHERMEAGVYRPSFGTPMFDGQPMFRHMPSGDNPIGDAIYALTESEVAINPMSRQLLHLAAHAQELPVVHNALALGEALFLDRWWWSTVAYGWGNLEVREGFGTKNNLINLARRVWDGIEPDVIYLFLHPHVEDKHNTPAVKRNYLGLAEDTDYPVVLIEPGTEAQQNMQILQDMVRRGIYTNGV